MPLWRREIPPPFALSGDPREEPQSQKAESDEQQRQTRPMLVLSAKKSIPTMAVPAVPMPTKVAYTVAAGRRLTASANR